MRFLFYLFIPYSRFSVSVSMFATSFTHEFSISDIRCAHWVRDVRVYLVYLFIYCVPLIYSVCGNWDRSSLCVLFVFIKSVLWSDRKSYHAQIACWSTQIHSDRVVFLCVVVAVLDSRFDIFSSLSLAHSFMLIVFVGWMISSRHTYHIIIYDSNSTMWSHNILISFSSNQKSCPSTGSHSLRNLEKKKKHISIVVDWNVFEVDESGNFHTFSTIESSFPY